MNLVEVSNKIIVCDSSMVAKKFGMKHAYVVDMIKKLISDIAELRVGTTDPYYSKEDRIYRGNEYTAYLMSREFFSLLAMRFKGKKALEWQMNFNKAFYDMESVLLKEQSNKSDVQWITAREQGKEARKLETNVIQKFVDYATERGSKSAKFYYKNYTNATYKALGLIQHNKPKLRDTLDFLEVSQLVVAENMASNRLEYYMNLDYGYKEIYQLVKKDLEAFGESTKIMTLPKLERKL